MLELFALSFSSMNLPFTLLLGICFLYWGLMLLGVVDLDFLDFDLELDGAADGLSGGGFLETFAFFNIGQIPFMIFLSFFSFFLWCGSIIGNSWFNGGGSWGIGLLVLLPNLVMGLLLTKLITTPLKAVFHDLNGQSKSKPINGKVCKIISPTDPIRMGQAEIIVGDAVVLIHVKSCNGLPIEKGKEALIIDQSEDQKFYLVQEV